MKIQIAFFRDVLAAKGKGLDARQKLEKMRNLKVKIQTCSNTVLPAVSNKLLNICLWQDGNLEVKKVGGITVTKKVK